MDNVEQREMEPVTKYDNVVVRHDGASPGGAENIGKGGSSYVSSQRSKVAIEQTQIKVRCSNCCRGKLLTEGK
jgi:hypothetical protein